MPHSAKKRNASDDDDDDDFEEQRAPQWGKQTNYNALRKGKRNRFFDLPLGFLLPNLVNGKCLGIFLTMSLNLTFIATKMVLLTGQRNVQFRTLLTL